MLHSMTDIEDLGKNSQGKGRTRQKGQKKVLSKDELEQFVLSLLEYPLTSDREFLRSHRSKRLEEPEFQKGYNAVARQHKAYPKKFKLYLAYQQLVKDGRVSRSADYEKWGLSKRIRSSSGVLVVTVFTAKMWTDHDGIRRRFDCAYDCHYCPDEPGQPRSYLSTEPGVMRAIENEYNPIDQFNARMKQLVSCGHVPDKIEILVLGGTWSSYPMEYREDFIRDLYYAANTWKDGNGEGDGTGEGVSGREPDTLLAERVMNEVAKARIIGVTLETRPDQISRKEMEHFRRCGCTRVQLGIQHTNNDILKKINRQCTLRHNIRGIRFLKEAGFKVDIHLMPDLPGSSIEIDRAMFQQMLSDPDLQADQWKIYPTAVTEWTKIKEWYEEGSYVPYAETNFSGFMDLLIWVKCHVHPWIRLNRVIRDIPEQSMLGGYKIANLRNHLEKMMKEQGKTCACIRCREIRDSSSTDTSKVVLTTRTYQSSGGTEHYISFEDADSPNADLYGHLRLRFNGNTTNRHFPELSGAGLIRELHVYGVLVATDDKTTYKDRAQHRGLGGRLLEEAERLTLKEGLAKIAVIAGDGVKPYYRNKGYMDVGHFLVKDLQP